MTGLRNATILSLLVSTMFLGTACGGTQAAGGDGGTTHTDGGSKAQPPTVTISAPTDGASYAAGTSITFTGAATDPVDGTLSGNALSWTSDKDGALGLGATVTTALTTVGTQSITLTATDKAGHSASASISLTITAADVPQVTITSPAAGHQAAIGEAINFKATVTPPAGATVSNASIVWTSSLDGQIGIGATVRTGLASPGTHTITCTATDSNGKSGSATVSVDIVNHVAPTVTINTPADGAYYRPTDSINFTGNVTPATGSTITSSSVKWTDENGGTVGLGTVVTTALPLGDHTITLSAADNTGATGSASIMVHVVSNLPPVCSITRPQNGRSYLVGQTISFQGSCTDPDSTQAPTPLTWTTDVDGVIGRGGLVQTALPTAGDRVVSLCAPDPVDPTITGCSSVTIHVNANTPPSCAISAPLNGDIVQAGDQVQLNGTITDAEDPSITGLQPTAAWTDDQGTALGNRAQSRPTFTVAQAGTRILTLTGTDSGGMTCTATVTILVNRRPTAQITSVTQNASPTQPFNGIAPVDFLGTGSDPDGNVLTFTWTDSFAGAFGSGTSASLATPTMGHHTVFLTADDGNGGLATATAAFTVMPATGNLVQPFTTYNTAVQDLQTRSLVTDSTGMLSVGNFSKEIWRADGTSTTAAPTLNAPNLPDDALTILLDEAGGQVFIGTRGSGYLVCNYNTTTGIDMASCNRYWGQDMPSDNVQAIAQLTDSNGNPMLVVGTDNGIFIPNNAGGGNVGRAYLDGRDVRGMAVDGSTLWIATNGSGLYHIDPAQLGTGGTNGYLGRWRQRDGAPSDNLFAVAVGYQGEAIWVGSDNGLGRYAPLSDSWSTWQRGGTPTPGLVGNQVNAIAIDRPTIGGLARDVIWCGTGRGVSRFDASIPSFMNLTTADGLPSNQVNAIAILPDGTKVFGTQNGLARYTGQ